MNDEQIPVRYQSMISMQPNSQPIRFGNIPSTSSTTKAGTSSSGKHHLAPHCGAPRTDLQEKLANSTIREVQT